MISIPNEGSPECIKVLCRKGDVPISFIVEQMVKGGYAGKYRL